MENETAAQEDCSLAFTAITMLPAQHLGPAGAVVRTGTARERQLMDNQFPAPDAGTSAAQEPHLAAASVPKKWELDGDVEDYFAHESAWFCGTDGSMAADQ